MAFAKLPKLYSRKGTQAHVPAVTIGKAGINFNVLLGAELMELCAVCVDIMHDSETGKLGFIFYDDKDTAPRDSYIVVGRGSKSGMGAACAYVIRTMKFKTGEVYPVVWDKELGGYVTVRRVEIEIGGEE